MHSVYTDGSCINNGRHHAVKQSGWGTFWGDGNPANNCGPIFVVHTNNYAELVAVYNALKSGELQGLRSLTIFTDSDYVVKTFNCYIHKWKRTGWTTSEGHDVLNGRIIKKIDRKIQRFQEVRIEHVPGHSDIHGNRMAHNLAKEGARKCLNTIGLSSFNHFAQLKHHVKDYFRHCERYTDDENGAMNLEELVDALKGLDRRITDERFFNRIRTFHGCVFSFCEFVIIAELATRDKDDRNDDRRYPMIEYDRRMNNGRFRISSELSDILVDYYDQDREDFDYALDEFMCLAGLWQRKYDD